MHPTTQTLASVVAIAIIITNVALQYFGISGAVACTITRLDPAAQQAASAALAR